MKWTSRLLPLSILLAVGALLAAYGSTGKMAYLAGLSATGTAWSIAVYRGPQRLSDLCGFGLLGFLLAGALFRLPPVWLLGAMLALLAALDLDHFRRRCRTSGRIVAGDALERQHLARLSVQLGIGGGWAVCSQALRLRLRFGVALLLVLLAAVTLSHLVTRLRRMTD